VWPYLNGINLVTPYLSKNLVWVWELASGVCIFGHLCLLKYPMQKSPQLESQILGSHLAQQLLVFNCLGSSCEFNICDFQSGTFPRRVFGKAMVTKYTNFRGQFVKLKLFVRSTISYFVTLSVANEAFIEFPLAGEWTSDLSINFLWLYLWATLAYYKDKVA